MLRQTLEPLLLPPFILGAVLPLRPEKTPTRDFIQVFIHCDAEPETVSAAWEAVRGPVTSDAASDRWVLRPCDAWGKHLSAAEAISILDGVTKGGELKPTVRGVLERFVEHPRERELRFNASVQAARRFCKEVALPALRANPLVSLVGVANPEI